MDLTSKVKLNDGHCMPIEALGVWQSGSDTKKAVSYALAAGYRHIDTAAAYGNETEVGEAIRESGIDREDLFITTKMWNDDIRAGNARGALEASLKRLGVDYVDLYLLHWPVKGSTEAYLQLEELQQEGLVRSIGVSNFKTHQLNDLLAHAHIVPAIDQMEFNPQMQDDEVLEFCKENHIQMEAWSPLGSGACLSDKTIQRIGEKYDRSSAQIILRWLLQKGIVVLPKSVHQERIIENSQIYDFKLAEDDMMRINHLNLNKRTGPDPDHFNF